MTIIAGGVWADGAFARSMRNDGPALTPEALSMWARLVPDPLGRPYNVLRTHCAQHAYTLAGNNSAGLRSECQQISNSQAWGTEYVYHWRMVIPLDWPSHSPTQNCAIAQIQMVNSAGIGRRPPIFCETVGNEYRWEMTTTANPLGRVLYAATFVPGEELEFTVRACFADGYNTPAAQGRFDVYVGDVLVYTETGSKNTYDGSVSDNDPYPPFLKAGLYQWNNPAVWWQGKSFTSFQVASVVGTADETPQTMRAYVNARLAANGNYPRPVSAWSTS